MPEFNLDTGEALEQYVEPLHFDARGRRCRPPQYLHQSYPKMLYHATLKAKIVKDAEAEKKLGKEWSGTPIQDKECDRREDSE